MKDYESLLPLVWFFKLNPHWYDKIRHAVAETNDTFSYCTELWEDVCEFQLYRAPLNKDDGIWDELLVKNQMLRKFSELKRYGFFSRKVP